MGVVVSDEWEAALSGMLVMRKDAEYFLVSADAPRGRVVRTQWIVRAHKAGLRGDEMVSASLSEMCGEGWEAQ